MKLRTVTLIWWAVLLLGAVAWCRAQDRENVTQIISHYADTDSAKGISISFNGPSSIYPRTTLTLDSLVVLWDEYKSWCDSDSGWIKFQSLAKCRELGYTVEDCGWHIKIYRKADIEGFMDFIRRKAGE